MLWTEEDLRQLRQDSPARLGRSAAPEQLCWNQQAVWHEMDSGRDPGGLFWGIVEPCLSPEERRIWGGE
jgi:hypothetical protein